MREWSGPGTARTAPDLADSIGGADDVADRTCSIPGCEALVRSRGWCVAHYTRYLRHGHPLGIDRMARTPAERFWFYVSGGGPDDCWEWKGYRLPSGHGKFSAGAGTSVGAYRFAYELMVGPIPDGLVIDHLCKNPPCVNPLHLEPVTPGENTRRSDAISSRNARKTHCIHGHEFTPENTYVRPDHGGRSCRACMRKRDAIYAERAIQRAADRDARRGLETP